jgi:hypothetical protein
MQVTQAASVLSQALAVLRAAAQGPDPAPPPAGADEGQLGAQVQQVVGAAEALLRELGMPVMHTSLDIPVRRAMTGAGGLSSALRQQKQQQDLAAKAVAMHPPRQAAAGLAPAAAPAGRPLDAVREESELSLRRLLLASEGGEAGGSPI